MSNNIDHIEVLSWSNHPAPYIAKEDFESIAVAVAQQQIDLPESSFLEEMVGHLKEDRYLIPEDAFWWCDESSDWTWPVFLERVAPLIKGRIEAYVIRENGEITGLRIDNGKVSEPAVRIELDMELDEDA